MINPGSLGWRKWRHAGLAICLAASSPAPLWASDLSSVGSESHAGTTVAAVIESETVNEEAVNQAAVEAPPMYRLPTTEAAATDTAATGDSSVTPLEEPADETWPNAESRSPTITTLPPCDENTASHPGEPSPEMVNDMNAVWSEGFPATPAAPAIEPENIPAPQLNETLPNVTDGTPTITPYAPTNAELSRQLLPMVRRGYGLAQHGAVFAAQTEFIQVLRRIAESKDAAESVNTHAKALAAGLRALDEADDFAPQGAQLEADMDVAVVVSAHRTPVLHDHAATTRPAEAIAMYHQFARQQLAQAVAGEQAGSMALYGLGKVQNRLARDGNGELCHERKALTMFLAALDAGPGNHLAANEVGVLLTRSGQPAAASTLFRRAIDLAPTSTNYHNLAVTDRQLGYHEQAVANEQYAWQLAQRDRAAGAASQAKGVQWVAPQELSRVAQPMPNETNNNRFTGGPQGPPQMQPPVVGAPQTAAKWPQKLVPGVFRR